MTGFAFHPLQYVKVTAFGLNYQGRVTRCVLCPNDRKLYEVEYASEGELKRDEFNSDELRMA